MSALGLSIACSSGDSSSSDTGRFTARPSASASSGNDTATGATNAAAERVAGLLPPDEPPSAAGASTNDAMASAASTSLPMDPASSVAASNTGFVTFSDPDSNFQTEDVRDADRQLMHFDAAGKALVWADNGDRVSGWVTQRNDLSWSGSGVQFRVRFGTEAGEPRAFFTETGSGTICNLEVSAPEQLSIFGTSELPPSG
jgi:hypothetical protein